MLPQMKRQQSWCAALRPRARLLLRRRLSNGVSNNSFVTFAFLVLS
jgi:hypothetical protein